MDYIPYTYLVGWSKLDLWYYGVQYSKKANPQNLWRSYFTSSKYVRKAREQYGEPDVVEVRKTFTNKDSARLWEHKVLVRMKVRKDKRWLNQTDNLHHYNIEPKAPWNKGKSMSDEQKQKLSAINKGKTLSEEHRRKMSQAQRSRSRESFVLSAEGLASIRSTHLNKPKSDSTKEKMRIAKLGVKKELVNCPYCDKSVAPHLFNRWHNKNCKYFTPIAQNHDK